MPVPPPIHQADFAPEDFIKVASILENIVLHGVDPVIQALRKCGEQMLEGKTFGTFQASKENLILCDMLISTAHTIVLTKLGLENAKAYEEASNLIAWLVERIAIQTASRPKSVPE